MTYMMNPEKMVRIPTLVRFYVYGIHGYVTEILFTALWEFVVNFNWKLPGNTNIWSFPIYGISCLVIEHMYDFLTARKVSFLPRMLIYTLWVYFWEFGTGFVLKQFGACPWDYTPFHGDFMGLVTLEYAPLWFIGNVVNELFIMHYARRMFIGPSTEEREVNGSRNKTNSATFSEQNGIVKQD